MSNDKKIRFQKIAPKRVQRVLDSINSLSKCSNKYNYEYTKEEKNKIIGAVNQSFSELRNKFNSGFKKNKEFTL